jgi:hypothetical protein
MKVSNLIKWNNMELICHFKFMKKQRFTKINNIGDVHQGFWIDANLQFNPSEKIYFWIPANKVTYVEVVYDNY